MILLLYKVIIVTMIRKSLGFLRYRFTIDETFKFLQTKLTEQKMKELRVQYRVNPSFQIFKQYITNTSDYFKVFQLVENESFNHETYQQLRNLTSSISESNDNLYLLRARITARIAENYYKNGDAGSADKLYNESLQIFEQSMIPQVMPYYSVYRKYGLFLEATGQKEKAAEVLSESVEILSDYVRHSDDPVTSNYHSLEQAKACVKLIYLQPEEREKWLKLANQYWAECETGVHENIEYAQTVLENTLDKKKVNPKKARLYAEVEMDKIPNEDFHKIISKAFEGQQ